MLSRPLDNAVAEPVERQRRRGTNDADEQCVDGSCLDDGEQRTEAAYVHERSLGFASWFGAGGAPRAGNEHPGGERDQRSERDPFKPPERDPGSQQQRERDHRRERKHHPAPGVGQVSAVVEADDGDGDEGDCC